MEVSPMRRLSAVLIAALAVVGCKKSEPPAAPVVAAAPAAEAAPAAPQGATIKGKVLERIDVDQYSYLKLQSGKDEVWAAVPRAEVKKGDEVTVVNGMPMPGFKSDKLNKTFEQIYFGTLEGAAGPTAPPPGMGTAASDPSPANLASQHANLAKVPAEVGDVKVPKATGPDAKTVEEVYQQKAKLKEKDVTLRGKVVKYNAGIMGKNWIHLRDGSGKDETADLLVTTSEVAAVNDVVTVKGKVKLDMDFGYGYAYKVLVEDAKITK
jgi:uncharacterized protein YdeI (BOF family)